VGNDDNAGLHFDDGVNEHEWATLWADIDDSLNDSPREALPDALRTLHQMLVERGVPIDDTAGTTPSTEDVPSEYFALRDTVRDLEDGRPLSDEDVADAVGLARELYRFMVDDYREWGPVTADEDEV
jgi:hypothetical protein